MNHVPAPLEWHPAYRNKTWLLDWLEQRGPYAGNPDIRIPVPAKMIWSYSEQPDDELTTVPETRTHQLTRRKCFGPAPYVGRPFLYMWPVGVDELGRCIAGDTQIVYMRDEHSDYMYGRMDPWQLAAYLGRPVEEIIHGQREPTS